MSEEDMEKNIASNRSACGLSKNPSEPSKKDNGRGNGNGQSHYKKREASSSKGATEPSLPRRANPQKSKGFTDKRPRGNASSWTGRRDEVTKTQRAEFGSALSYGPKKMDLTHLINFTMAPRETSSSDYRGPGGWRGRNNWAHRYPKFNKEQFLQANCQFVVKAGCDYTLQRVDADKLVDWDLIEQVRILSPEVPSCPICLYPPIAAKITRCGHIYCWTCLLHYLALDERTWRKCPICYEAVHQTDLKSVVAKATHSYSKGDEITFRLMKREKGSVVTQPHSAREYGKLFTIEDEPSTTCMVKLVLATPEQVKEMIIEPERAALKGQLQESNGELQDTFTEAALKMIKEREQSMHNVNKIQSLASHIAGLNVEEQETASQEPKAMASPPCKNYKRYLSAFSDEEIDSSDDHSPQGFTIEEPFQDYQASPKGTPAKTGHQKTVPPKMLDREPAEAGGQSPSAVSKDLVGPTGEHDKGDLLRPELVESLPGPELVEGLPGPELVEGLPGPEKGKGMYREEHEESAKVGEGSCGKDHVYYFYQAEDGQHLYLQSLNVRCLTREYGSFAQCPERITARVVEVEHMSMNEALRRRLRFLFHLPLTCEFGICELELKPPLVSKATIQNFAGEFQQRKKARERKCRNEKKQERKMQLKESQKNGKYPSPKFSLQSSTQFPSFRADSLPGDVFSISETASYAASLDSTVSSSLGSPTNLSEEEVGYAAGFVAGGHHNVDSDSTGGHSPIIGSWASTASMEEQSNTGLSFAQMLRAGKSKPTWPETSSWPKTVTAGKPGNATQQPVIERRVRKQSAPGPDGSDGSSNEEYAPIPQYRDAFSDAIQAALDKAAVQAATRKTDNDVTSSPGSGKRGKKGKKKQQQLLFSTAGPRFK